MENNLVTIKNNKSCSISLLDNPEVFFQLRKFLSYKTIGVEWTQAYKNGWDGVTFLIDKKGNFPLGLLDRVSTFLKGKGVTFTLLDKRASVKETKPLNIAKNLVKHKYVPRDYQLQILEAAEKNRKGIIRACTGSGKTLAAALITAKFNRPTIIYVIGLDLLGQFHKTFSDLLGQPIGYIGNGICQIEKINIASVWTIGKALDLKMDQFEDESKEKTAKEEDKIAIQDLLEEVELHIFDECHSVACDTIKEIYKKINPVFIYGMSGTPYRDDGSDLLIHGFLGEQICNVTASELIKRKILAQPVIKFVNVPAMSVSGRTYADVYSGYIVENDMRNSIILLETKKLVEKKYQVLVLFKHIKHGKLLFDLFKKNKIDCEMLSGIDKLERRNDIKDRLLNKKLNVVLASTIYDIGVDISSLSGLVLAGGGKSSVRALQRIGRVIRAFPNKHAAAIVDFMDNVRFLKEHSKRRHQIYMSEPGFIVKPEVLKGL